MNERFFFFLHFRTFLKRGKGREKKRAEGEKEKRVKRPLVPLQQAPDIQMKR